MEGIILINKEATYTSRDVVNIISKEFNRKKVGHTGTLDPMATGVLVICLGQATKIVEILTNCQKEYLATIILGTETDTLDITGNILKKEKVFKTKDQIEKVLREMIGTYYQEVPLYSAIKVNGKKLYKYARAKEEVKIPKKEVTIQELSLVGDIKYIDDMVTFQIKCLVSKGTYVRSLIRDIAYKLETIGTMTNLIRLQQGDFKLADCQTIEQFKKKKQIISLIEALKGFYQVKVDDKLEFKIKNGQKMKDIYNKEHILFVNKNNQPLALYKKEQAIIRPWKMFI